MRSVIDVTFVRLLQQTEEMGVHALVPQQSIKAFDEAVFHRLFPG